MPPFDPENVRAAIPQVPSWGTERIKQVLQRARDKNISALVEACEEELQIRGPKSLSDREAADAREISRTLAGKRLEEVIELAFGYREADADEIRVIQWIAANPGTSYQETLAVYGKGDLSLVIGHLVYHRFGHFRAYIVTKIQSDLLIERTEEPDGIHYRLRPETISAFLRVGFLR